jgi:hypothetical protein
VRQRSRNRVSYLKVVPLRWRNFHLLQSPLAPAKKILILAALTGELANATADTAQAIIGRVLQDATAKSLDTAVFGNVAGDSTRPAGLLNGLSPITTTAAGGQADHQMITDVANLAGAISDAGINAEGAVLIANPREAIKLRMLTTANFTNAVLGSPQIPSGTVIAVAPDGLMVGYSGAPDIESSIESTVHFEDTTPLQLATGAQGSGVLATPTKSAFQQDLIIIKLRARCAWTPMPGAVQYLTGVNW